MCVYLKAKDSAIEVGLPEREAAAWAVEFIKVRGKEEAAQLVGCECYEEAEQVETIAELLERFKE